MNIWVIIIILLLVFGGIGTGPWWGYHNYGWYPSGGIGLVLLILLVLFLMGKL